MTVHKPPAPSSAARIVASNLVVDATAAEALQALAAAGVESVLLKGVSFARWLYSSTDPRSYVDCDLLIRPTDLDGARIVLAALGYVPQLDEDAMPDWWQEHATGWWRQVDGAIIDVHRTLPGVGVAEEQLWARLTTRTLTTLVAGVPARTLSLPGLALHVALHAAQHGSEWQGAVHADLERAVATAEPEIWAAAAALASELDATSSFAAGLRLIPSGRALAETLALAHDQPVGVALRTGGAPREALTLEQIANAGSSRARAAIVWRKLVPPASFMRHWWPAASTSRRKLVLAYLWYRPVWLARKAPGALLAWHQARRRSRV